MFKCESCGHIHWEKIPAQKKTFELVKDDVCSTSREVADHEDISIQAASNRLCRLSDLGVIEVVDRRQTSNEGFEKVWGPANE